jgi:hypothetical protein
MYDEDGKDHSGNFMGTTPQQTLNSGVNSTDNLWSAHIKIEQTASDDLRARLKNELQSELRSNPARGRSQGSAPFKLVFFSLVSFGLIAYVAWHAVDYLLGIFVYAKDSMHGMGQKDILNHTLLIIGGLLLAAFFLWFKLVKFFSRAFITKR